MKKNKMIGKTCVCGHVIYYTKHTGVTCFCNNPRPRNQPAAQPAEGVQIFGREHLNVNKATQDEIFKRWHAYKEPDENEIAITWHVDDVKQERPDLTLQQAREVLQYIKDKHDATLGVSWETLRCAADELFPNEERTDA